MNGMEAVDIMVRIWVVHALIALALTTPVVLLGRKRVHWRVWELSALLLPFCVWAALMLSHFADGRKSLANLGEPVFISYAVPVAALARIAVGGKIRESVCSVCLIAFLCLVAAGVFCFTPPLPE
jgi:hypothetical protein